MSGDALEDQASSAGSPRHHVHTMMTPDLKRHLCEMGVQSCLAKSTDRKELVLILFP